MEKNADTPKKYADFRELSIPLLTRLANDCVRSEKRPRRQQQTREIIDFIQVTLKFTESRDAAATSLRTENARLKAQVTALQGCLTPKAKAAEEAKPE